MNNFYRKLFKKIC